MQNYIDLKSLTCLLLSHSDIRRCVRSWLESNASLCYKLAIEADKAEGMMTRILQLRDQPYVKTKNRL